MEALNPLKNFLRKSHPDPRIRVTHIAVYMALYERWLANDCKNPIAFISHDIMEYAKISSSATWHKSIRSLHEYGYINYQPTFNRMKSSEVYL